jgi:hypothetical protein
MGLASVEMAECCDDDDRQCNRCFITRAAYKPAQEVEAVRFASKAGKPVEVGTLIDGGLADTAVKWRTDPMPPADLLKLIGK